VDSQLRGKLASANECFRPHKRIGADLRYGDIALVPSHGDLRQSAREWIVANAIARRQAAGRRKRSADNGSPMAAIGRRETSRRRGADARRFPQTRSRMSAADDSRRVALSRWPRRIVAGLRAKHRRGGASDSGAVSPPNSLAPNTLTQAANPKLPQLRRDAVLERQVRFAGSETKQSSPTLRR
jgi:hypothetical protein